MNINSPLDDNMKCARLASFLIMEHDMIYHGTGFSHEIDYDKTLKLFTIKCLECNNYIN